MKILTLVVNGIYFDQIESGHKKEEYREIKYYWSKRLTNIYNSDYNEHSYFYKQFDAVKFRRGYAKNAKQILVKWNGCKMINRFLHTHFGDKPIDVFAIQLGDIIKN